MRIDVIRVGLFRDGFHRAVRIYRVTQLLRWFEEGNALRGYIDLRPSLRVAACARIALPGPEASETANLDLVTRLQGSDDGVEECVDDNLSVATGEVAYGGDLVYEVSFSHCVGSFRAEGEGYFCRIEKLRWC